MGNKNIRANSCGVLDMIRITFVNDYINGQAAAGRQQIDYKTIFPDSVKVPEDLRDEYGNLQYKIQVDTIQTEDGEQKKVSVVKDPQHPTTEQIAAVEERKLVAKIRQKYSLNDELALLHRGDTEKRDEFETYVAQCKTDVEKEISKTIVER